MGTKWLLLTFGDGSRGHRAAAQRLVNQALSTQIFDHALAIDGRYLRQEFPGFWKEHGRFIESHPRGFGFWVWKPYLIRRFLHSLPEGWALAYLDAGCVLNDSGPARARMEHYKRHAIEHSIWACELQPNEGEDFRNETWCKADTLLRLGATPATRQANQIQAGILLMANDTLARRVVEEWYSVAIEDDYHFLDDSHSRSPNAPSFREHRHDQAILNLIFRRLGLRAVPDETSFPGAWLSKGIAFPIWAARWTFTQPFRPDGSRPLSTKLETLLRLGAADSIRLLRARILMRWFSPHH